MKYVFILVLLLAASAPAANKGTEWTGVETDFSNRFISHMEIESIHCQSCILRNVQAEFAKFKYGFCKSCNFSDLRGTGLQMRSINIENGIFQRANLRSSDLSAVRAYQSDFSEANLSMASLWSADLRYSKFIKTDLRGANLENALLKGSDLHGALFDAHTRLPFSKEEALRRGMQWQP